MESPGTDTNISHSCLSTRRMDPSSGRTVSQHMAGTAGRAHARDQRWALSSHRTRTRTPVGRRHESKNRNRRTPREKHRVSLHDLGFDTGTSATKEKVVGLPKKDTFCASDIYQECGKRLQRRYLQIVCLIRFNVQNTQRPLTTQQPRDRQPDSKVGKTLTTLPKKTHGWPAGGRKEAQRH